MLNALLVGLLALGFMFSGGIATPAAQNETPVASQTMTATGSDTVLAKTYAYEYATKFYNGEFANKGELKGPFQYRFANMFEQANGWDNELPENANVDARTPDKTRAFTGEENPITPEPLAQGK